MSKLYNLESQVRHIVDQEYNSWKLMESRTVREVCDRIKSRISNSFNIRILNDEDK